ncbi:MAG: hypothetical protein M0Z61_10765 [Nitrospiraceae bacterium]|nr:hypothetical protein [Nitrospiraceae bacterium]
MMYHQLMIAPYLTTGIGSLPHEDAEAAVTLILGTFDIPFWPQLPRVSFREQMIPQYSEGLPFIRVDSQKKTTWVNRSGSDELERFYETYNENTRIAISENFAEGLHTFLRVTKGRKFKWLKGHVTGPLTFTLGLNDYQGKPVYYDEELREVYLMGLQAKARWQIDALKAKAEQVVIFIDEPIASALGSTSYMSVAREEALRLLKALAQTIKELGAIPGIHCCGRAEWPLLMESGAQILSFDAYDYGDTLAIYQAETEAFLKSGGILAWGIVPTTDAINSETEESLYALYMRRFEKLSSVLPADLLRKNILLTPSCGTGSLSEAETIKAFELLIRLKESLA